MPKYNTLIVFDFNISTKNNQAFIFAVHANNVCNFGMKATVEAEVGKTSKTVLLLVGVQWL